MVVVEEREGEDSRSLEILQRELHNSSLALPSCLFRTAALVGTLGG